MTAVTGASPPAAPVQRFPAEPLGVRQGRRFVRDCLVGLDDDLVDTVELLACELMTNCLLHAQTPFEVRLWGNASRVHVRVSDGALGRTPVTRAHSLEDTSGRGLQLVEELAAYYGVDRDCRSKTVWFEVWAHEAPRLEGPAWPVVEPSDGVREVELAGVPVALYRAAHRHREALLREAKLHTLTHGDLFGVGVDMLLRAESVHDAIAAQALPQLDAAPDHETTLRLRLPTACAEAVADLQQVLDLANSAAREGRFLTRPALPEVSRFRAWLFAEVGRQLQQPGSSRPWRPPGPAAYQKRAARTTGDPWGISASQTPMVVAGDDNVIQAVNQPLTDLLGWSAEQLVGHRLISIIPPAWRQRHIAGFTSFLLTGTATMSGREVTVPALTRDGQERLVRLLVQVRHGQDGRTAFLAELRPHFPFRAR
jgi:PAS domain S-box-containing protein